MRASATLLFLCVLAGCADHKISKHRPPEYFPKELVGIWKDDGGQKTIEIDEQGKLKSFTYAAGLTINVAEGGMSQKSPNSDSMLYMILGETVVEYNQTTSILKVIIDIDDYRVELPEGGISGTMKETIEGEITDNFSTWSATSLTEGTIESFPQGNDKVAIRYHFRKIK